MIEDRFALDATYPEVMAYLERRMVHFTEVSDQLWATMTAITNALGGIPGVPELAEQEYLDDRMKEAVEAQERLEGTRKDIGAATAKLAALAESAKRELLNDVAAKGQLQVA